MSGGLQKSSRQTPVSLDIVADVFAWASREGSLRPRARPDLGALQLPSVLSPSPSLVTQAGAIAARHASRLGLLAPPLGQTASFGLAPFLLALAIGFMDRPELLVSITTFCELPSSAWDLVLRDALVSRVLALELSEEVLDALRVRSPLSCVLERPAAGGEDDAIVLMDSLAAHDDGRRLLVSTFARPSRSVAVLRFRASVLDRLRLRMEGPLGVSFVLEVYEARSVFYGEQSTLEIEQASREVCRRKPDPGRMMEAIALASYWAPLARIRRASPEALRSTLYLDLDLILSACRLVELASREGEGAL